MNTNRIAPIAGSMWFWRGIAALEALLLAAAVAITLAGQLPISRAPTPAAAPAASVSAPAAVVQKGLIACGPCRAEVLAEAQAQLSGLTAARAARVIAPATAARRLLIACGPCRAEVLAEAQVQLSGSAPRTAYTSGVFEEQQVDPRGTGPQ